MKSPPLDFLWGHPWTPLCHLHFSPSWPLLLNSISIPSWPQSSPTGLCSSLGSPPSSRVTSQLLDTPPWVFEVSFLWHLKPHHKWGSWLECWYWCGVHISAWDQCTWHIQEIDYEREKSLKNNNKYNKDYSSWKVHQTILPSTHTSLTGISIPYLNCGTTAVLLLLLSFSLLRGPLSLLVSSSNILVLRSHNLRSFSLLQYGSLFL